MDTTKLERRTPSQSRSIERREHILAATRELVVHEGSIDGITTRLIAERAELPIGSIYYLFPNVNAIYYAILAEALSEAHTTMGEQGALEHEDWAEGIDASIDGLLDFFSSDEAVSIVWQALRNDPELEDLVAADSQLWEVTNRNFLADVLPTIDEATLSAMARVSVRIIEALLNEALASDDPKHREMIARELKFNLKSYVSAKIADAGTDSKERN